jgi:hypothetical protein
MAGGYHLVSLLGVGLGLTEPALWPPMFGSFTEAYTMRKLWGEPSPRVTFTLVTDHCVRRILLASELSHSKAERSGYEDSLRSR